jgi:hypothetical protein
MHWTFLKDRFTSMCLFYYKTRSSVKNYDNYIPANVSIPYDVTKNYKIIIILVTHFSASYPPVKIQTMLTLSDMTSFKIGRSHEFKPYT